MHAKWMKGCKTNKEREERKKQLQGYRSAFDELEMHLLGMRKSAANRNYSSQGWAHEQISVNEYNAAIDDLMALIKE